MANLYIDTRNNKNIIVRLVHQDKKYILETDATNTQADSVLQLITKICKTSKISINQITQIYCEKGPGSFTGLRVGFAVANALSLALFAPLNDNKIGTIDTPVYA